MNKTLFCIKIGGSVITDKTVPYKARIEAIRNIAKVLKKVKSPLLISHGSGSFAHTSAAKYGGKNGYTNKWGIAKVASDAMEINHIVMNIFIEEKLPAISFSPRSFMVTEDGNVKNALFEPIAEALNQGLIPVIYGDVIWDVKQKTTIYSGETSLNILCSYLQRNNYHISKIIQLCNVDGVLNAEKEIIPDITNDNWHDVKKYIESLIVADVTGGIGHKVEAALLMTQYGIQTWLMNGTNATALENVLNGEQVKGTVIR